MPAFPPVICFCTCYAPFGAGFANTLAAKKWEDEKDACRITLYEIVTIAVHAEAP